MTYSITFTATTVTVRKGLVGVRSTTNPALIGAYASLYALHGDKVLPHVWQDIAGHAPAKAEPVPARNASVTRSVAYPPTGCAQSVPLFGATMQPRLPVKPFGLKAHGVETQYQSKNYYLK